MCESLFPLESPAKSNFNKTFKDTKPQPKQQEVHIKKVRQVPNLEFLVIIQWNLPAPKFQL